MNNIISNNEIQQEESVYADILPGNVHKTRTISIMFIHPNATRSKMVMTYIWSTQGGVHIESCLSLSSFP